ncbi:MAG: glycosyltransferase family 4 protein [Bacteroidetes Order II. Incertae sedis bacterium]|nr:glycosyltransferase family 4 protein [Bacteroidetes Order II. bacterium]MBT7402138.1 glycosyltransferase family 4 protein [Bacteroidetes Order II. bacterium]
MAQIDLTGIEKICVQWPRFGPYHLARLHAAHKACSARNIEFIALETAAKSGLYEWKVEDGETPFDREQVFVDRPFEDISPTEMHDAVIAKLNELNPDVVAIHTYSLPDSRACLEWCKDHGKASIVMTNSKADDAKRSPWKELLKSRLIGEFDAALLAGTPQKAYFEDLGFSSEHISLGYNVVDNDFFATMPDSASTDLPGLSDDRPFILASNRFLKRKNLFCLLEAYASYRALTPHPYRMIMLGDGALRPAIEAWIEAHQVDGIELAGFRQIDDLPHYYHRAAFFVHPARIDTWAMVVNEAMAAGLPVVISTGTGCHKDLVDEGQNGFTFHPDDAQQLAQHMVKLSEDASFRESAGARSREIMKDWTLDRFVHGLFESATTAMKRRGRKPALIPRIMIRLLRSSSSSEAFHSVES